MKIFGDDQKTSIKAVAIFLTASEAAELRDSLEDLLESSENDHHHISSYDYTKEITVEVYDPNSEKYKWLNDKT